METQVTPSSSPRSTVIGSVRTFRTGCASRSGTRPAAPCCMTPRRATRMVRTPFASSAAQMMQQLSVEGQLPSVGGYERILPKLAAALGGLRGKRILEVGCGYGSLLLAARLQGAEVIGNDISGDAVRFLREQLNIPGFDVPLPH